MKEPEAGFDEAAALGRAGEILCRRFGFQNFLPGQEKSLACILAKQRHLVVVMPTGAGKSLLYQLPALAEEGLTIVISPLISLMKDQVDELERKGIPATFVNSSLGAEEQRARLDRCMEGRIKLLYVAPERFRNASFLNRLDRIQVARMAVDEAHCISEWGHDFRPDYRRLKEFRERMNHPLVTALTATATARVQQDIIESLGLEEGRVDLHVHGFDRPNLALGVVEAFRKEEKAEFLLEFVQEQEGPGIVYTGTRRASEEVAEILKSVEPRTVVYHAGLDPEARSGAQDAFLSGKDRIVVATTAFGMGIDKHDVRFVVHYNYPGSIEQYYQEIGRAGRDGLPSRIVLLYAPGDHFLREFFIDLNYPGPEVVNTVYETLWEIPDNPVMMTYKQIAEICGEDMKDGEVGSAVRLLDGAGMTRALSRAPTLAVNLFRPLEEILPKVQGPVQRRVLEGLSSTSDLGTPDRIETSLHQLCASAGLAEDQVRRALTAMDQAGVIRYDPPFRGRGIEKRVDPPPPFSKVPIDWEREAFLRRMEEEKLETMEAYISDPGCRRGFILRYFGEKASFRCGSCDRCDDSAVRKKKGPGILAVHPKVALPVLVCVLRLRFPLGKGKIVQIVCGARTKEILSWGAGRNPGYGRVTVGQGVVKNVVDDLIREGYLKREGEARRPVLVLTDRGEKAALGADLDRLLSAGPARAEQGEAGGPEKPAGTRRKDLGRGDKGIRIAALKCVAGLKTPLGAVKIAELLKGSKAKWVKPMGADRLEVYGARDDSLEALRKALLSMIEGGLLRKGGNPRYPVLEMTPAGQRMLEGAERESPAREAKRAGAPPKTGECALDLLDGMIQKVLSAERDRAKEMLAELSLFHPGEIARRIGASQEVSVSYRARARAVWVAGELCGPFGLSFLVDAASSEESEIRRLAASALGKVKEGLQGDSDRFADNVREASGLLALLAEDPEPAVRDEARRSLDPPPPEEILF